MPAISSPFNGDQFRRVCSQFATGVTIVTTLDTRGEPHGFTANSFVSVSLEPPLVMICIDLRCSLFDRLGRSEFFGINFLAEEQVDLSNRFAQSTDPRFDGVEWHPAPGGIPEIDGTLGFLLCRVVNRIPAGDHVMMLGEVVDIRHSGGSPLLYFSSRYGRLLQESA